MNFNKLHDDFDNSKDNFGDDVGFKVVKTFRAYVDDKIEFVDSFIQESYWYDDFSTQKLFDILIRMATEENIEIEDENTVEYDSFLSDVYNSTEKGLS